MGLNIILGMVTKLAEMGSNGEGDTLTSPSIEYDYDLTTWQTQQKPVYAHVKTREKHADANTKWLERIDDRTYNILF